MTFINRNLEPYRGYYIFMRAAARRTAVKRYDLATICLPQQVRLIEDVASIKN